MELGDKTMSFKKPLFVRYHSGDSDYSGNSDF